jgi:hypothetical protein
VSAPFTDADADWYDDTIVREDEDVTRCPFCLRPEEHDDAGQRVFCCREMAAAAELGEA